METDHVDSPQTPRARETAARPEIDGVIEELKRRYPHDAQNPLLYREACEVLFQTFGVMPTGNRLYQLVRRGSMQTVQTALREYLESLRQRTRLGVTDGEAANGLPADLAGEAAAFVQNLFQRAVATAERTLAGERALAQEAVRAAQLAQENAEQRLATALKDIQRLEALGAEQEQALAREIERAAATERHIVHLQGEMEARDQIAREQALKLETKIAHLEEQLAREGEHVARERSRADRIQQQRDEEARVYRTGLETAQAQHQRDAEAWAAERQQYLQDLTEVRKQLQKSEAARAEAHGKLTALTEQTGRLREELTSLSVDKQRLVAEIAGTQARITAMEKAVVEREGRIGALEGRVATLTEKYQRLQVRRARAGDDPNEKTHD